MVETGANQRFKRPAIVGQRVSRSFGPTMTAPRPPVLAAKFSARHDQNFPWRRHSVRTAHHDKGLSNHPDDLRKEVDAALDLPDLQVPLSAMAYLRVTGFGEASIPQSGLFPPHILRHATLLERCPSIFILEPLRGSHKTGVKI